MNDKFPIGTAVRPTGGGPRMTVEAVDGDKRSTSWVTKAGKKETADYHVDALELAGSDVTTGKLVRGN